MALENYLKERGLLDAVIRQYLEDIRWENQTLKEKAHHDHMKYEVAKMFLEYPMGKPREQYP